MKIQKSTFFRPRKSLYGNFELAPDKGWEILQTFIDFESGFLIVSTIKKNEDHMGQITRPNELKQYVIDLHSLEILSADDYKAFFDYELKESFSNDGKLHLISQRIHDSVRNNDFFVEKLYDAGTGTLISSGEFLAFSQDRRENLLEKHYALSNLKQQSEQKEADKLSLSDLESIHKALLKKEEPIISFYNELYRYTLIYTGSQFEMLIYSHNEIKPTTEHENVVSFSNLEDFWEEITADSNWFMALSIDLRQTLQPFVLSKQVIETFNILKKQNDISYDQHDKIYSWEKVFIHQDLNRGEVKQFCSSCNNEVRYNPRYPKYICSDCSAKHKYSKEGQLVEFYNTNLSGGLKIIYKDAEGNVLKEDDSKSECICLIDGKDFIAQEARFGGIVIQKNE
jgi:hypothetical protein